ncbi:MAG: shikimate kinase [Oscillospiraceae bacterium]
MNELKSKALYLCGFMGCGKSTIGKITARRLGKRFIDLDFYIEQNENMKIPDIFEKYGEDYFRQKETEALEQLSSVNAVVATGGGALLSDKNGEIVKKAGIAVYIDTPFEICYSRIKGDKNRPIAYSSTKEQLEQRYNTRKPLYMRNSSYKVSGVGSPIAVAQKIIDVYYRACRKTRRKHKKV